MGCEKKEKSEALIEDVDMRDCIAPKKTLISESREAALVVLSLKKENKWNMSKLMKKELGYRWAHNQSIT